MAGRRAICPLQASILKQRSRAKILASRELLNTFDHQNQCFPQEEFLQTYTSGIVTSSWNNWLPETEDLYRRLKAMAETGGWVQVRNTNTDPRHPRLLFSRVTTENGPVIHHAAYILEEEKKLHGVCQFGDEAQGPEGFVHGGACFTMHDTIATALVHNVLKVSCVTATMTVNCERPIPLRSAILMGATIDKVDGNKAFLTGHLKSPDEKVVYSYCTALFIIIKSGHPAPEEEIKTVI